VPVRYERTLRRPSVFGGDGLEQQMAEEEKKVTPFRAVKRKSARKQQRVAA